MGKFHFSFAYHREGERTEKTEALGPYLSVVEKYDGWVDLFYRAVLNILKDKCVNNAKFGRQRWRPFHVHLDLAIRELVCHHIFWDSQANPSKNCKHNHSDTEHHPYQKLPRRHQEYTTLKAKSHLLMGCQTLWDAGRAARQLFVPLLMLTWSQALPTENLGFC